MSAPTPTPTEPAYGAADGARPFDSCPPATHPPPPSPRRRSPLATPAGHPPLFERALDTVAQRHDGGLRISPWADCDSRVLTGVARHIDDADGSGPASMRARSIA